MTDTNQTLGSAPIRSTAYDTWLVAQHSLREKVESATTLRIVVIDRGDTTNDAFAEEYFRQLISEVEAIEGRSPWLTAVCMEDHENSLLELVSPLAVADSGYTLLLLNGKQPGDEECWEKILGAFEESMMDVVLIGAEHDRMFSPKSNILFLYDVGAIRPIIRSLLTRVMKDSLEGFPKFNG